MLQPNPLLNKFFNTSLMQQIQDHFAEQTGVASIISDLKGVPYTKPSNFSILCNHIRASPKGGANCMHSDSVIGKKANRSHIHIQPCLSGGLWDAGACLYVGDVHVANWLIGQVMNEAQDLGKMMSYAKQIEVDEETFSYALTKVTVMTEEQYKHTCQALFIFANTVSECAVYKKDLSYEDMDRLLQVKQRDLAILVEQEPNLEAIWSVWEELATAAKAYQLVPQQ